MENTKSVPSRVVILGIIGVATIFAIWWFTCSRPSVTTEQQVHLDELSSNTSSAVAPQKTVDAAVITAAVKDDEAGTQFPDIFYEIPPASLAESPTPAALQMTESGGLIINLRIRELFEYYLTASGEEPLENIIARIKHAMAAQLDSAAYAEAEALLEGYLQFRNNAGVIINRYNEEVTADTDKLALLFEMKQAVRQSRSDYLPSDAIDSFFAEEDAYDAYMHGKASILGNTALSEAEKEQELQLLELDTPQSVIASDKASRQISNLRQQEKRLRDEGAGDDAINALRERELGAESAERLARLDEKRRDWDNRMDNYRKELRIVETADEYPPEEKARLIEQLRAQHFSEQESIRVRALDNIRN
jgi:lipase chaperone LimK